MRAVLIVVALAACTEPAVTVAPVYDLPTGDPDAVPTGLDRVTLAVAIAGSDQDLVSVSFGLGGVK